jgi:RNA polymerase sigma factor (sigma-70 family)
MTGDQDAGLGATQGLRQSDWDAFRLRPDEETFRPVYDRSRALVWTISMRILGNPDDAADAMQSAFCRLLLLAAEPDDELLEGGIQQALYRIAVREANNLRMRRQRRAGKEVVMAQLPSMAADEAVASQRVVEGETRERVERIVESLPDRFRLPILLHYFDGLSHREVALAMGTPVSTVTNRIARAHKTLEGLFRKAGLGAAILLLAGVEARAALMQPPASMTAESVFQSASASLAGGGATAFKSVAGVGSKTSQGLFGAGSGLIWLLVLVTTLATVVTLHRIHEVNPKLFGAFSSGASPATAVEGNTRDVMARGGMGLFDAAVVDEALTGASAPASSSCATPAQ